MVQTIGGGATTPLAWVLYRSKIINQTMRA